VSANPAAPSVATPPVSAESHSGLLPIVWVRQHPAVMALVGFALLALLLAPIFSALPRGGTIQIGSGYVPTIGIVWLVAALAVSVALVRARLRVERALLAGTDALIDRTRPLDLATAPARIRDADMSALGASMVSGLLSLLTFLVLQSAIRRPFVEVVSAWLPEAWVDDVFVILVVAVTVLMLISLHRLGSPVILQLAWSGLDAVAPTAGFDSKTAPAIAQPRQITRSGSHPAVADAVAPRPLAEGLAATSAPALPAAQTVSGDAASVTSAGNSAGGIAPTDATVAETDSGPGKAG
jgi:hypothetical protein